ncbi:MAG: pyrimidine/purine nucleoside phosphorylase [Colwellia sp.]
MSDFKDVSINRAANVYFDGKVTSRTITFNDGSFKTLGIMQAGDYKFDTKEKELMEITVGECEILLAGTSEWQKIVGGQAFYVDANSSFEIKAKTIIDYCCTYIS